MNPEPTPISGNTSFRPQPSAGHRKSNQFAGVKDWEWTGPRELAATLVAHDDVSDVEIAKAAGTVNRVVYRWKRRPEFQARVAELREDMRRELFQQAYCRKERRLEVRQALIDKCLRVIEERAKLPEMA